MLTLVCCRVAGHSIRVLPHLQNTGGFFVALFRKTASIPMSVKTTSKADARVCVYVRHCRASRLY